MKVVKVGSQYQLYTDSVKTYDALPAGTYAVRFDKMTGFFLEDYHDFEITEDKIYGDIPKKVEKSMKAFKLFNRNLGIILSGKKGIGKSLFAKLLAKEAISQGYPVIVVSEYVHGIASFLEQIDQEVVVLFDEFDKVFERSSEGEDPQNTMLSLFDGMSAGKKMFVVTCNNLTKLNDFLVNRPGRFHYHFRFECPSAEEVREYLNDKVEEAYRGEIEKVVSFSRKVDLNYDCLRAVAFELNMGESFESAVNDLNIVNVNKEKYNVTLRLKNGEAYTAPDVEMDLFDRTEETSVVLYDMIKANDFVLTFDPVNCVYDCSRNAFTVKPEDFILEPYYADDEDEKQELEEMKEKGFDSVIIVRKRDKDLHYSI